MTSVLHTIVHIEDEASHWRALPRAIRNALFDRLDETQRASLFYRPPEPRLSYPAKSTISWNKGDITHELHYWLIESATIAQISEEITGVPTFIVDVMRPGKLALESSLAISIKSIEPFVRNWEEQVRVFTAFAISDADPERPLKIIKKSETPAIVEFLMQRVITS